MNFFVCFPKGVVEFGTEVTGKDQKTKMLLNDQDRVRHTLTEAMLSVVIYLAL